MFCNECGQELLEGTVFCPKCGTKQGVEIKKEKSRTIELVLALLGGIFGFFGALFAIGIGGLGGAFEMEEASKVVGLGFAAIVFSIIGIVGAVLVKSKNKNSRMAYGHQCLWWTYFNKLCFLVTFYTFINRWHYGFEKIGGI